MPQLDPTWFASQLFWLFVSFALLYYLLAKVILPPLMDAMERRQNTVDSDISVAQSCKTQAEEARQQYERTLAEARANSQQLIDSVMVEHKAKSEQAARELEKQIAAKIKESERKIVTKKQELMDALTPTTAEMTALIVEKLTQRSPANDKVKMAIGDLSKGRR